MDDGIAIRPHVGRTVWFGDVGVAECDRCGDVEIVSREWRDRDGPCSG